MLVIKNRNFRCVLKIAIPFLLIPLAVLISNFVFGKVHYLLISLIVAALAVLLFIAGFEKKQVGSRRLVLAAVMTALCIVGRFIPFFKPITAITVISALYLGGQTAFLIGAISALLSNFYFGQGPWTPFQMMAFGLIGLIAGYISDILIKHKSLLLLYAVISGVIYSLIMDVWTVVWYSGGLNIALYLSAALTALPHTLMYAVSNFLFLWFLAKPFGEKLERIKIKYGI